MKVLAIAMTMLMLLTVLSPCKDDEVIGSKAKAGLSKASEDNHGDAGVCSPFCKCARCSFSVLLPQISANNVERELLRSSFPSIIAGSPTWISHAVWQPPKFA